MTCLFPPQSIRFDEPNRDARQQLLEQVAAGFQGMLNQWREQGLPQSLFLDTSRALSNLFAWTEPQLQELRELLESFAADPQACRDLALDLRSLLQAPSTARLEPVPYRCQRALVLLRPLLSLHGLAQTASASSIQWPQLEGDPLALPLEEFGCSIRTFNVLRRNGIFHLADLVGLDEERLLAMRGLGTGALRETRDLLDEWGLGIPFSLEEGWALPPLPSHPPIEPIRSGIDRPARMNSQTSWQVQLPAGPSPEEGQAWAERAAALLSGTNDGIGADRLLHDLQALTIERFPSLRQRLEEIHQLRDLVSTIDEAADQPGVGHPLPPMVAVAVQEKLLHRYALLLTEGTASTRWLAQLRQQLERRPQSLSLLLQRLVGRSLQALGDTMIPRITREAVRLQIVPLERLLGFSVRELASVLKDHDAEQGQRQMAALLGAWIVAHGRLPFHTDAPLALIGWDAAARPLLEEVRHLSLQRRLRLHAQLALPVPTAEWDLHFRVLVNNEERPGPGYWEDLEPLRQFLPRFAELVGAPGRMPYQTQLPASVRASVQRHGGQSKVARALDLTYQGQLVGESGGRIFWTDLRLELLLEQTVHWCRLPERAMPSRLQIRDFMASGVVADYLDKRFESVYAALTRQSTLSWEQAAARFGRA